MRCPHGMRGNPELGVVIANCSNCSADLREDREIFGYPSHVVCLLCWLDPPAPEDPIPVGGFIWTTSGENGYVDVPPTIAGCPECALGFRAEIVEWESESRKPTEDGVLLLPYCECECNANAPEFSDQRAKGDRWVISNVRISHEVHNSRIIPGIVLPASWGEMFKVAR